MTDIPPDKTPYVHVSFYITEENYQAIRQAILDCNLEGSGDFYQQAAQLFLRFNDQANLMKRPAIIDDANLTATPVDFDPLEVSYQKALARNAPPPTPEPPPKKAPHLKLVHDAT